MKLFFLVFSLSLSTLIFCQNNEYNRVSFEINAGIMKPIYPLTRDFKSPIYKNINFDIGSRFMLNDLAGIKAVFNVSQFKFESDLFSLNDSNFYSKSYYYRTTLEGIVNLGKMIHLQKYSPKLGLLLHGGSGFSILQSKKTLKNINWKNDFSDIMINVTAGATTQYKINEYLVANLDLNFIAHLFQTFAFDMNTSGKRQGFDGMLFNISTGLTWYLGEKDEHFDWKNESK
ncbi:MAG: hypothetical protein V4622_04560 [Bacteroidota bacterium]